MNILKGKHILITAGPTWVPIDKVRVITNIFSGRTGCDIARLACKQGAKVKLLLGPGRVNLSKDYFKGIEVARFKYFDELLMLTRIEVGSKKYDAVIHSAAIADYIPVKIVEGKISSGRKELIIRMKPTVKIIKYIKKWDPGIILAQFKLEVGKTKNKLIRIAKKSMLKNNSDFCVANDLDKLDNLYIIERGQKARVVKGRAKLPAILLKLIAKAID
jgi:phosphopantothenoylcysteine synthetase/decarboxylase